MNSVPSTNRLTAAFAAVVVALALGAAPAVAQQDTIPAEAPADSTVAPLDEQIERILGGDTAAAPRPDAADAAPQRGRAFQGLNPDISVIGELLTDLSPEEPRFVEGGSRFRVREVELGIQAVVDPYFRADFFIGIHPEAVEIEEAYLTALVLPWGLRGRIGRFLLPFGKINTTHRPELATVDYPFVIQEYFGEEGFASSGVGVSKIFAPFGFFQEIEVYALSGIERHEHGHGERAGDAEPEIEVVEAERDLSEQLAFLAHLKNYWNLTRAANIEFGLSAAAGAVGHREPLCETGLEPQCRPGEIPTLRQTFETQTFYGADLTVRWRPPARAIYRSFRWTTEVVANDAPDDELLWGGVTQATWQLNRRWYVGGRFDAVQLPAEEEPHLAEGHAEAHGAEALFAGSGYLTFYPSEFSRFKLGVQRTFGDGARDGGEWRAVLQTTFSIGPHRPHAF